LYLILFLENIATKKDFEEGRKFNKFNTDLNDLFDADENSNPITDPEIDQNFIIDETMPDTTKNTSLQHITDFLESLTANPNDTDHFLIKPLVIIQKSETTTSTPMRSILKKNLLHKEVLIKNSPIGYQETQVGITQALNLLVETQVELTQGRYPVKLKELPYGFYYKRSDLINFELVSTVEQLFEEIAPSVGVENSCGGGSSKKRKLRFDESSIQECSVVADWEKGSRKRGNFQNLSEVVLVDDEINEYFEMVIRNLFKF